ncbi:MAG: hypothetical protein ACRDYX_12095 [Egibacteraceae bacterium]
MVAATVTLTVTMDVIDLSNADEHPVEGRHVDNLQGLLKATGQDRYDPGAIDGSAQ